MKKEICLIISIVCLILLVSTMIILFNGFETHTKKAPCVDGVGDINLEGIMCEKNYETFYGISDFGDIMITVILLTIGFIFGFMGGLILYSEKKWGELK